METLREIAMAITDGVIALNGDVYNIIDFGVDMFRQYIEDAGELASITPEKTDREEWGIRCAQLELIPTKTKRIYLLKDMDTVIGLFASVDDYTI